MSEWITDRLPTEADSDMMNKVWVWEDNAVYWSDYSVVTLGTPWMPNKIPAPYVKPEPQRWKPEYMELYWTVDRDMIKESYWLNDCTNEKRFVDGNCFQTRAQAEEAAQRVRETLLNYHKELLQ